LKISRSEDNEGLEVLEGVTSILQLLPQKFWTIVTSATERLARSRLAFAGVPVPEHIITADMVANGKPHPGALSQGREDSRPGAGGLYCDRGFAFRQ
jgi:sugar-phosphatase